MLKVTLILIRKVLACYEIVEFIESITIIIIIAECSTNRKGNNLKATGRVTQIGLPPWFGIFHLSNLFNTAHIKGQIKYTTRH